MGKKINASIYIDAEIIRKARDLGLNISKTCENALKEAIKRLEHSDCQNSYKNCPIDSPNNVECGRRDLNPGRQRGRLNWHAIYKDFMAYLDGKRYNERWKKCMVSYLSRYVSNIESPMDIIEIFSKVKAGRTDLERALRVLFNFMEAYGYDSEFVNSLRKALPKVECGIDLKIPTEADIVKSISKLETVPTKYQIVFRLLLDSGLRLTEAVKIVNEFKPESVERVNGFCRILVGQFRGSKQAYYAYFSESTFKALTEHALNNHEPLNPLNVSHYFNKYGLTAPKYLRKFMFDTMITLGVPESVADFIQGRVARRIGAKHYMSLVRQADSFYGKYQAKIAELWDSKVKANE